MRSLKFVLFSVVCLGGAAISAEQAPYNSATISGLGARNIGSAAMSGRVSAIAASRESSGKTTIFVGAASGGVWKSEDGGTRYKPVFDEQPVQSIGAIAIDPKNSQNVWVGSGEAWTRNSVSVGDGVYKSTDNGETWSRAGLPNSERVAQIVVSPTSGDTVYAAVPGALWSDSPDRGLYKTTDGGKTWSLILKGANLSTGASTIALDPTDPNKMFAGLWDFRRKGWEFRSGGNGPDQPSGSGLFRSADGGTTWTELTPENSKGFPKKPYGRLAVAIAPSNAKRVYVFVESTDSALFVSDDGGLTWDTPQVVFQDTDPTVFNDKEWIVTDNNPRSPFYGRTYVTWTKFKAVRSAVKSARVGPSMRAGTPPLEIVAPSGSAMSKPSQYIGSDTESRASG
jgi:photosystem II stability/assembly factor-like uncharacterized protein